MQRAPALCTSRPAAGARIYFHCPGSTKIIAYGITMMTGTLAVLYFELRTGIEDRARTLAFTTFVMFQFFNASTLGTRSARRSISAS